MKLAPVQSSTRGQKASARPRLPLLWQFVSYQSVISDELPAQDWGGSRESKHGVEVWVAQTLGEQLDTWPRFKSERDSKRNLVVVALQPPHINLGTCWCLQAVNPISKGIFVGICRYFSPHTAGVMPVSSAHTHDPFLDALTVKAADLQKRALKYTLGRFLI